MYLGWGDSGCGGLSGSSGPSAGCSNDALDPVSAGGFPGGDAPASQPVFGHGGPIYIYNTGGSTGYPSAPVSSGNYGQVSAPSTGGCGKGGCGSAPASGSVGGYYPSAPAAPAPSYGSYG